MIIFNYWKNRRAARARLWIAKGFPKTRDLHPHIILIYKRDRYPLDEIRMSVTKTTAENMVEMIQAALEETA